MRNRTSKVREYRQPIRPNAGIVVFAFIFIYILIYALKYAYTEHIAIYEVIKSSISENNEFKGVIIRDEKVIKAKEAGYITYYAASGTRVAKNDMIFSIDEGSSALESLTKNVKNVDLRESDYNEIANEIEYNRNTYSDSKFYQSYSFVTDITNRVLELRTGALYENMEDVIKNSSAKNVVIDRANSTGIISSTTDEMEKLSLKTVNEAMFNSKNYTHTSYVTGNLVEKGAPVYRIVKDDTWNILIKLNKSQYNKLKENKTIGVTFKKNNLTANADIEVKRNNSGYYGILTLYDYMINYIDDRFINIQLAFNKATGLKIPNSAITDKKFYVVPKKIFITGGNSDSLGLLIEKYSKTGAKKTEFVKTDIFYEKDDKYYIDADLFEMGTKVKTDGFVLNDVDTLQGVYNVNKGYAEFRCVEVMYSSDEYSIVKENCSNGLFVSKYDHIVLDASKNIENKIIH